jgi:hypothetical protein
MTINADGVGMLSAPSTGGVVGGATTGAAFGPWGALIGGIAGGLFGLFSGSKAADLQEQAARMKRLQVDEEVRRFDAQAEQQTGIAEAIGAASGVDFQSESLQKYLSDMTSEFRRQSSWLKEAGYAEADAINKSAGLTRDSTALKTITDIGSSLFQFSKDMDWFK